MSSLPYPLLLQCISQKICHDLATPIGAIRLGLENLPENEFTPILMQSIDNATHRIDIFRSLFSTSPDSIDYEKANRLLKAYLESKNIAFTTTGEATGPQARLILGLGVVMTECLPRGGTIDCDFGDMTLSCRGPIVQMPFTSFTLETVLKENLQFKSGIILFHILTLLEYEHRFLDVQHEDNTLTFQVKGKETA